MNVVGKVATVVGGTVAGSGLGILAGNAKDGLGSPSKITGQEAGLAAGSAIPGAGVGMVTAFFAAMFIAGKGPMPQYVDTLLAAGAMTGGAFTSSHVLTEATQSDFYDSSYVGHTG